MKYGRIEKLKAVLLSKKKVLVLGDSHTEVFSKPELQRFFSPKHLLLVETVGGATISGLTNPNSQTQALPIFERSYKKVHPEATIIQLGEVDTGFVLWYRAEKYQISVDEMLSTCIENYRTFIQKHEGKEKTVVVSAPLPTITDDQDWGDVASARKDVTTSQVERTLLTIKFNSAIKRYCFENNYHFIDLDPESLGSDGVVNKVLLNSDPNDHHYDEKQYVSLLVPHLAEIFHEK